MLVDVRKMVMLKVGARRHERSMDRRLSSISVLSHCVCCRMITLSLLSQGYI